MSATSFTDYAQEIQALLHEIIGAGSAQMIDLRIDSRSNLRGYI
jgi:hypothetical protein